MSSVSCSICWEIVTSTCAASYLQCGHVYHQNCLEKWLKTSKTCPECRNGVVTTKRIYLNLVPDPEIEVLNSELIKKAKEYEFLVTGNEIQDAIIKQLEKQMSAKEEELLLNTIRNDELKSSTSCALHRNEKLKLELEMHVKQQASLTNEVIDLKSQLVASQTKNVEITNSTVALKEYYREQVKQISDLHSEILNLTERLDQFRGLFVAANNKLQVHLKESEVVKSERDSLQSQNSQLFKKMYSLKLQAGNKVMRKIRRKYFDFPQLSAGAVQFRRRRKDYLLRKTVVDQHQKILQRHANASDDNLRIKLVKSKLSWICVKS